MVGAFVSCNGGLASALEMLRHESAVVGALGRVSNVSSRDRAAGSA